MALFKILIEFVFIYLRIIWRIPVRVCNFNYYYRGGRWFFPMSREDVAILHFLFDPFAEVINNNTVEKKKQQLILCDIPEPWQFGFQDPATPIMEGIVEFHNDLMFVLFIIIIFILYFLIRIIYLFSATSVNAKNMQLISKSHDTTLETIWTIIPTFILFLIVTPSFALLYAMDEISEPEITVQVSGHQWYWHYDLSPVPQLVSEESFRKGNFDYSGHRKEDIVEVASKLSELANNMYPISIEYDYDSYMILEEDLLLAQTHQTPFIIQTGYNRAGVNPYSIFNDYDLAYEAFIYFIASHYMTVRGEGGYNVNMYLVGDDCSSVTDVSIKSKKYTMCKSGRTHYVDLPNIHSAITRCDKVALFDCDLIDYWNESTEEETKKWLTHEAYPFYEYSRAYPDYCESDAGLLVIPLRLLTTDTHIHLPTNTHIRLLVTSGDVLHSWAVPSLGVKVDACPGRLNMVNIYIKRPGMYYGQCSEICGVLHSYMPVVVTAVDSANDDYYLRSTLNTIYWSCDHTHYCMHRRVRFYNFAGRVAGTAAERELLLYLKSDKASRWWAIDPETAAYLKIFWLKRISEMAVISGKWALIYYRLSRAEQAAAAAESSGSIRIDIHNPDA